MSADPRPARSPTLPPRDRKRLVALLRTLAPDEGYNLTALPSVRILRSNRALSRTPVLYDPGIVIVCQGSKRGYFGGERYLYDEHHYLAVSVPVPFSMETDATPDHPLLALYLHLDFTLAAELAAQIDREGTAELVQAPRSMMSTPMDEAMHASVLRFVEAMHRPLDAVVLGPRCCASCISACSPARRAARCAARWRCAGSSAGSAGHCA